MQRLKAPSSICFTFFGTITLFSKTQPLNESLPIYSSSFGNAMSFKLSQFLKVLLYILIIDSGIEISAKLLQLANAPSPIYSTVFGISISSRLTQLKKYKLLYFSILRVI